MENEFFLNATIPSPMPAWTSLASAMEVQTQADESPDCFFNWEKSTEQSLHFDSALSSMVSSPAASYSNVPNDNFVIRELIGKLGNIGNSGEMSPHSQPLLASSYVTCGGGGGSNSTNTSCYSTPLNSPPKLNLPAVAETTPLSPSLTELSADPGFAERAARFSCFGSRSFNGRTSQFGLNQNSSRNDNPYATNANPLVGNGKLARVSSSRSLNVIGSTQQRSQLANSQDQSAASEVNPNGDSGLKAANDAGSRKRKAASKGKGKETSATATKVFEANEDSNAKRIKASEGNGNGKENECVKAEEEAKEDEKQNKSNNTKPPEPPKDYIHVRARRGQATDSHSLAERVRREKISERMKLLQDLVPGCNKVTGKALMLDEIINYVQSLQRQVEFLSMKLASVNTRLDVNMDSLMSKDMLQQSSSLPNQLFPLDSSASAFLGHQPHQNPTLHSNLSNGTISQSSVDHPLIHLPPLDHFTANLPQCSTFCEGDLQTIVQMGFGRNPSPDPAVQSQTQNFHGNGGKETQIIHKS